MARHIHSRLKIAGTLITETPLHVGGLGESPDTDMPLARNGRGEFYIPGTSITGVIRAWCKNNFDKEEVKQLFGYQEGEGGQASFVVVEDIALDKDTRSEIRDGVGIDRFYGTAADKAKFDCAVLPRGTELTLKIIVEVQSKDDAAKTKGIFGHLLDALWRGDVRLGAARTRGLGKVKLTKLKKVEEQEMSKILDWLNSSGSSQEFEDENSIQKEIGTLINGTSMLGQELLTIAIEWQPKSSLMVKAGYDGIGVDTLPLVSGNGNGKVSLCVPGSSIKGAFRAHAERVMRTVLDCGDQKEIFRTKNKQNFHDQIKEIPLVDEIFGAKKEKLETKKHLGLGALSIDDCYAASIDAEVWNKVETGEMENDKTYNTQSLWKALKEIDKDGKDDTTNFKIAHHIAIDRWTGGASEGALYSVLQPTPKIEWGDICMTLNMSRIPTVKNEDGSTDESLRRRCLMLLLLVLRDFAENRLPLGFATNRGMGEVIVKEIKGLEAIPKSLKLGDGGFAVEIKDEKLSFKGDKVKDVREALEGVWSYE